MSALKKLRIVLAFVWLFAIIHVLLHIDDIRYHTYEISTVISFAAYGLGLFFGTIGYFVIKRQSKPDV